MERRVRFALNRDAKPTVPDGEPGVKYGRLNDGRIDEVASLTGNGRGSNYPLDEVRLLPSCWPSKIVCVGRNYVDHAKELNNPVPPEPLIFLKPPSSLIAAGDPIVYPAISELVNYEGELAVVIGKEARNLKPDEAWDAIYGYTCLNDVTARDLQRKDVQFTRGKGFDTFCPVGPWIVPKDDVDFDRIRVRTFVDGELKQDGAISDMIFPIPQIIAFITRFMTLLPGDLIATGTPSGVGPLRPGMRVRVEVEGVAALENPVIAEKG
jgi:2-keto-4-pentenoate hydratase/2-oxohepta-3-ene-1,7-dioic acid hydratase in catechol pathway